MKETCAIKLVYTTHPLVCNGDVFGLANGLGFRKYVRCATCADALELYAIMSGIAATLVFPAISTNTASLPAPGPCRSPAPTSPNPLAVAAVSTALR